jgi:hypothetical protein
MPWVMMLAIAGWAYIVATGRTAEAKDAISEVVGNVKGLMGMRTKLIDAGTEADTRQARPAPRNSGTAPRTAAPSDSADAAANATEDQVAPPADAGAGVLSAPAPATRLPTGADSLVRPPVPPTS